MDGFPSPDTSSPAVIDGQTIHIATIGELIAATVTRLNRGLGFTLFTLNMDHLVKRRIDASFRAAYARATFVTADGAPLVWLARRQGVEMERTTGADLLQPLCAAAAEAGLPVAFFGSRTQSLETAAIALRRKYPRLEISHIEAPPQGFDPLSRDAYGAAQRIARSGARICFVALGAPKQEFFADRMLRDFPQIGFLGVGAALDFVSGDQKRAPLFFQKNGIEWAWRLGANPIRLAARYFRCATLLADIAFFQPLQRKILGAPVSTSIEG